MIRTYVNGDSESLQKMCAITWHETLDIFYKI